FPSAEYSYWLALQLFPNHPGFLVQYAHALKEQGKTLDALIRYLDAFFLGANRSDVQPHAIHTAESTGFRSAVLPVLQRSTPGMVPNESSDAPLGIVSTDVMAATKLMHKRTPSKRELVSYMCEAATWPELMLSLMKEKVFSSTHRKLLRLIHETGWNAYTMDLKFSVVINTYNRADLLADALRGLSHLTYTDFEIIVVNG